MNTAPQTIDTEALRKLCEVATSGPWEAVKCVYDGDPPHGDWFVTEGTGNVTGEVTESDAVFIAAARDAIPAWADELDRLRAAEAASRDLVAYLIQQAQIWSMEARCHKSTVHEAYQAVTGATGEPGNWNGARPIVDALQKLRNERDAARAEIARLTDAGAEDVALALKAISDGYAFERRGDFVVVENPEFVEDNGSNPKLVLKLAPPPPAAAVCRVPGQRVSNALARSYAGILSPAPEDDPLSPWERRARDLALDLVEARTALATEFKAEDVRRETIEECARRVHRFQDIVGWQPGDSRNELVGDIEDAIRALAEARL